MNCWSAWHLGNRLQKNDCSRLSQPHEAVVIQQSTRSYAGDAAWLETRGPGDDRVIGRGQFPVSVVLCGAVTAGLCVFGSSAIENTPTGDPARTRATALSMA